MYATDVVSVTDLREKMGDVIKKVGRIARPLPVLANNQVQFYLLNNQEYELYQKLLHVQEMKQEVKKTKKSGKYFSNAKDAMNDLLS